MSTPFSTDEEESVLSVFRRRGLGSESFGWVENAIGHCARELSASIVRDAPYSFCLRIGTPDGAVFWLKHNPSSHGFLHEPSVTEALGGHHSLIRPVCTGPAGELLFSNFGSSVRSILESGARFPDAAVEMLCDGLASLASIQTSLADANIARLVSAGAILIPCSDIADLLADLLSSERRLVFDLTSSDAAEILGFIPSLAADCLLLSGLGIQDSWEHGDMNAGNILHDGSRAIIIDLSEARISHPLLSGAHLVNSSSFLVSRLAGFDRDEAARRMSISYSHSFSLLSGIPRGTVDLALSICRRIDEAYTILSLESFAKNHFAVTGRAIA